MITITTATAQIRPEIHHLPEVTPTITAAVVKRAGGMIMLVSICIERYFGDSRFHSYAGGANSSSITGSGYVPTGIGLPSRTEDLQLFFISSACSASGHVPIRRRTARRP